MTKNKMTLSDMYTQPHYRSIITLLRQFYDPEGLTQTQIRYALQEDLEMPDVVKRKMKRYFGKELEKLFKNSDEDERNGLPREIYRECIKKGSHLSYYLNKLVEYNIVEKIDNRESHPSYVLKSIRYEMWDIKSILSRIKNQSNYAISPTIAYGEYETLGNIDTEEGVSFFPFFVGFSPDIFTLKNKDAALELEKKLKKLEEAIIDFLIFTRKFSSLKKERTHIIIRGQYYSDDMIKKFEEISKKYEENNP